MFSSSVFASLVTFVVSAVVASAAPSLTLKTSTHNVNVDGLENLKVTTTITNTGDETLKLLNDPRGVLDAFPANTFTITDPTGSGPSFNGAKVKYSPAYAAGLGDPSVFTVLDPGAFINVTHDLSAAYNFTRSGAGTYSIEPSNLFIYIDADGTPKSLHATVEDIAEIKLSGNLAVSRAYNKRATFASCTWVDQLLLKTAIDSAETYASETYNYLLHLPRSTPRYEAWWGAYDVDRKNAVQDHFKSISDHKFSSFSYDCACTTTDRFAYVYPEDFGVIYLCSAFWKAPNTGIDSRAGTLIHESSHFIPNGNTADYTYGQANAKEFAKDYPGLVTLNADSHQYFAENDPSLS